MGISETMGISDGSTVCHKTSSIVSPSFERRDRQSLSVGDAKKTVAVHEDGIVEIISPFAFTFKIPFH
jgi:hypothetical protein